jgi:hypothetical protein
MTYNTGQIIENETYNAFATSVNEIYSDNHPGAITMPNAGYGYGKLPALNAAIPNGQIIGAAEWSALFSAMRLCGTHQNTTVVPPIPASGPIPNDIIRAVTTQATFDTLLGTLKTNSFNLGTGQTSIINDLSTPSSAQWVSQLVFTYSIDFGSWNNARYFFNTGGSVLLSGDYAGATTPDEAAWAAAFNEMSPLRLNHDRVISGNGQNEIVAPAGFYGIMIGATPTVYKQIYLKHVGDGVGPYYTTNYISVEAKLNAAPGTNGRIDFRITLIDGDPTNPVTKKGTTTYKNDSIRSTGAIPYPGTLVVTSGGFVPT